jgi:uncharacterized protein YndB with AHSA1/START domain
MEILHEMIVRTSAEKVYSALTDRDLRTDWFAPSADWEAGIGSRVTFLFDNGARVIKVEEVELELNHKVVWRNVQGFPNWELAQSSIVWKLTPVEWGTLVHFRHTGWQTKEGAFASVSYKWAWFMTRLKTYLETGVAVPS